MGGGGETRQDAVRVHPDGPLDEGEVDGPGVGGRTPRTRRSHRDRGSQKPVETGSPDSGDTLDLASLGLPTDKDALVRYLANSYKGVGQKTAETLVEEFGSHLFHILQSEPERLGSVVRADRVDRLLEGWRQDLARRRERRGKEQGPSEGSRSDSPGATGRRTRQGSRTKSRGRG